MAVSGTESGQVSDPQPRPDPLRVLVDASASLAASASVDVLLRTILASARQLIAADAYAVWRSYDGGNNWRTLVIDGLSEDYSFTTVGSSRLIPQGAVVAEDVYSDPLLAYRTPMYRQEGICSLLTVPLLMEGQAEGTIAFYYRNPHRFSPEEVQYATALANLAASALRTAELHAGQQRERLRLSFLAEASALLSSSLDYEATLQRVARLAVPHIGDWCSVNIVRDGVLVPLAVAHADPEKLTLAAEFARRYPESVDDSHAGTLLREGDAELVPSISDEQLVAIASDEQHLGMLRELRITSVINVPLRARGVAFGLLRLVSAESGRRFDEDDLRLAEDLARRASVAIDNANLYRELRQGEERYRSLVLATSALVFQTDPQGDLVESQADWAAYTGQSWEEHRGSGWAAALHPEDRDFVVERAQTAIKNRTVHHVAARLWHAESGEYRHVVIRAVPIPSSSGEVREWVGTVTDVHDQRRAEETLRRTEKLAAAGRLAATVAHEINNPLEAVTNLLYIAQRSTSLDADTRRNLLIADEELQRVAHIVRQTLGFYREAAAPRDTDLAAVVGDVLDLYRRRIQSRKLDLVTDIQPGLVLTIVGGEIKQVVANLLANAIDAIEHSGTIRVSVKAAGDHAEIEVADTGSGIGADHKGRLFEPFFTTKRDVGTGLGLWVSKGIVEKHGGTLTYESSTEAAFHGTQFLVRLPLVGVEPSRARTQRREIDALPQQTSLL